MSSRGKRRCIGPSAGTRVITGNPHVTGFEIPDTVVSVSVSVNREQRTGHNIVGYLPPSDVADVVKPHVMLGGHYDHLGYGTGGNSLARDDEAKV